jgi:hypothetical protein
LLAASLVFSRPAFAQDVQITEKARSHFQAGVNFLQDPDGARYEEAYREFRAAYAESPSWKILGNLGLSAMKLERDGEAIEAFEKYLAQGGDAIDPEEKAQFQRDLQTLKASVVEVTIESVPPGAMVTDERQPVSGASIVNIYGPVDQPLKIGIRSGHHVMTAKLSGKPDQVWEFEAKTGGESSHSFDFAVAPTTGGGVAGGGDGTVADTGTSRPTPGLVYVGLAATGLFAAGGAVVGIMAMGKNSDFEDANDGSDPAGAEEIRDSGTTLNVVADVLFAAAAVSAVITAVVYFGRPEVPAQTAKPITISPTLSAGGAGLSFSGAF